MSGIAINTRRIVVGFGVFSDGCITGRIVLTLAMAEGSGFSVSIRDSRGPVLKSRLGSVEKGSMSENAITYTLVFLFGLLALRIFFDAVRSWSK